MTALALHLPERHGFARWIFAATVIVMMHAAIVAAVALWYARGRPVEPNILPAIAVTLAPVESSSPEIRDQDIAVGPTMQQAEAAPPEPPKVEEKQPEQMVQPPPPQQEADVTLPKAEKEVEEPKPVPEPPAPETRAPPKSDRIGVFSQAGSNAYNALVFGHLQKFKRYPSSARGKVGTVVVSFVLNRTGDVIDSTVTKSSGSDVLDREALEILHRASPFPAFPAAKPGEQDTYIAPVSFAR
jgi:periplasmic protein TonB